jgi:hypothetical protein
MNYSTSTLLTCTAAILHYYLVALTIIFVNASPSSIDDFTDLDALGLESGSKEKLLEAFALEICGIAFTAKIPSVLVNAFGPIAYCKCPLPTKFLSFFGDTDDPLGARFIQSEASQRELVRQLLACKSSIGWPVERLVRDLKVSWGLNQV